MKLKIFYIFLLSCSLITCLTQIFYIPPYADDVFGFYKSGYFSELDREFDVIKESFLGIKMMSKPVYAWIFLEDIKNKYNMDIRVYSTSGALIPAPGEEKSHNDSRVLKLINSLNPVTYTEINKDKYYCAIPVFIEDKCKFCHSNKLLGALTFERKFDSYIYYSSERTIIFSILSFLHLILLFFAVKWKPARAIKELFDK